MTIEYMYVNIKKLYMKVANGNEAVRRGTATIQKHRKIANHHTHQSKIGLS
jgi:hypothetical protein